MDTAGLSALWSAAWGDCPPVSYLLRGCRHDRWVRFHSLSGSQRYARNDDERAEITRRHVTVLAELLEHGGAGAGRELLVLTASWSAGAGPAAREAELAAPCRPRLTGPAC